MKNEEVFFKMIHNTFDDTKKIIDNKSGLPCMEHMEVTDLFQEVFGQHVNKNNLK